MSPEKPSVGEQKKDSLIMTGSLPKLNRENGKLKLQKIENKELAKDKEVQKTRQELANFIAEELPFADEDVLQQMSCRQLLGLYLFYYNTPAKLEHFTTLYQTLRKSKLSEDTDSKQAKLAYLIYLFNKQPVTLQKNQLALARKKEINPELIEEAIEDINTTLEKEEMADVQKMTNWLESIHQSRQEKKGNSIISFHVARSDKIRGDISAPHGVEQENIGSDVKKIHAGARFFTTTTDPLYYPGSGERYLYLIYANQKDLGRMYDPSEKAVFSHAPLERIPYNDLPPIHLTEEVLKDLAAKFGTA